MSNADRAERVANRLVRLKEWQNRSAKITWVFLGFLAVGTFLVLCGYPWFTGLFVDDDDTAETSAWWDNSDRYFHWAWRGAKTPIFFGTAFWLVSVSSLGLATYAYSVEQRKAMEAPERGQVVGSLIRRVRNGDYGYHQGVETVLSQLVYCL